MIEGKIKTFEAPNNDSTLTERFLLKKLFLSKKFLYVHSLKGCSKIYKKILKYSKLSLILIILQDLLNG